MSVAEPFRKESGAEFLNNFHKLRKAVNDCLMRDFGIKLRNYDVHLLQEIYSMSREDTAALREIGAKYGMGSFLVYKYPVWRVALWRTEVSDILNHIGMYIEMGNSIRIDGDFYADKYARREENFENAIGWCNVLKDKFHEIMDIIDVKVGAYNEVAVMLKKEIRLLKGVKRKDKSIYESIKAADE